MKLFREGEKVEQNSRKNQPKAEQLTRSRKSDSSVSIIIKNLSYFCHEQHLFQLLLPILAARTSRLISLKIERSPSDGRSLLHAFAELPSIEVADYLISTLDGTSFMGRTLK
jgi:RNA recognition motif-containing protein